jgi:iron-sulfur cluster repair protein YtfE (RIC family)
MALEASEVMTHPPTSALAELATQHNQLRDMMSRCEQLADQLDTGHAPPDLAPALAQAVASLRVAFETHNRFEEELLRPLLREIDPFAAARIERMVADHIEEHREVRLRLGTAETATLRDVIETLRAHLDAEERYLLSDRVLRDGATGPRS